MKKLLPIIVLIIMAAGCQQSEMPTMPEPFNPYGVEWSLVNRGGFYNAQFSPQAGWGTGENNLYFGGVTNLGYPNVTEQIDTVSLWHYNGERFTNIPVDKGAPNRTLHIETIEGTDENNVWVLAASRNTHIPIPEFFGTNIIMHYNGSNWNTFHLNAHETDYFFLNDLSATGAGVYAFGKKYSNNDGRDSLIVLKYNGAGFDETILPYPNDAGGFYTSAISNYEGKVYLHINAYRSYEPPDTYNEVYRLNNNRTELVLQVPDTSGYEWSRAYYNHTTHDGTLLTYGGASITRFSGDRHWNIIEPFNAKGLTGRSQNTLLLYHDNGTLYYYDGYDLTRLLNYEQYGEHFRLLYADADVMYLIAYPNIAINDFYVLKGKIN